MNTLQSRGNSIASRDIASVVHPYTDLQRHAEIGPLIITGGKGVEVFDDSGRSFIEGMAGLWCASLGFNEPRLVNAATEAMNRLPFYHTFTHKGHTPAVDLAEKLLSLAPVPMAKVFFASSGSEANDTIIKIIWYINNALGRPKKKKIIARERGYHGTTVASASLTGLPNNHRSFDLPIQNILHVSCPHWYRYSNPGESESDYSTRLAQELEDRILAEGPETVAAFFAEPVMGAGGVLLPPEGYFPKIQEVLRRYDVLCVADEVICGFWRTGNYWGSQTFNIQPDIITCAKALSAAFMPISAVMVNERVFKAMETESHRIGTFGHGFTYSGHPVTASVALETLKIYEERDIGGHVAQVAPVFARSLKAFEARPFVGHSRSAGLMGAIELMADKQKRIPFRTADGIIPFIVSRAQEHGVLLRGIMDCVVFCPPLIIKEDEIAELFRRFALAMDDLEALIREKDLVAVAVAAAAPSAG